MAEPTRKKILKNTTGSNIDLGQTGHIVPASGQITIEPGRYYTYANIMDETGGTTLHQLILDGDIVVNDGVDDLSADRGIDYLKHPDRAFNVRFEASPERANGFGAKNVQEAIEETTTSPVGAIDTYVFAELGTATNEWLEYGVSSINSDETPAILPFSAKLTACTFTNERSSVESDIEVHRSVEGDGSTTTQVATFEVRNARVARFSDFTPIQFAAGDKFSVYARDRGTNASNVVVKLYFLIDAFERENTSETFGSDLSLTIGGITITLG